MNAQLTLSLPERPYWQTTPLSRDELADAIKCAERQDLAVLAIFRTYRKPMPPSQVHAIGIQHGMRWLLTSVRRSMTNLADAGALHHLESTVPGPHGRPEGQWCLA